MSDMSRSDWPEHPRPPEKFRWQVAYADGKVAEVYADDVTQAANLGDGMRSAELRKDTWALPRIIAIRQVPRDILTGY